MRRLFTCLLTIMLVAASFPVQACTLWSAAGNAVNGGGVIAAKNRDWTPNHNQELRLVSPDKGYRYIGLYAVGGDAPGLKEGINERGLVVLSASASSIPRAERLKMPHRPVLSRLLNQCDTVDDVLNHLDWFIGPQYILVADKTKSAIIEVGPDAKRAVQITENGRLYHTNHYVASDLLWANKKIGASSKARFQRIGELLENADYPLELNDFYAFSNDRIDGADNSIWRVGKTPTSPRTLSSWIIHLPPNGSPYLYVKLANPGEVEREYRLAVEDVFTGSIKLQ